MSKIGNIAFAVGTVAVALVAGYFMQAGSSDRAPAQRYAALEKETTTDTPAPAAAQAVEAEKPVEIAVQEAVLPTIPPMGMANPPQIEMKSLQTASLDLSMKIPERVMPKPRLNEVATEPEEPTEQFAMAPVEDGSGVAAPVVEETECTAALHAEPIAAAMVQLYLDASCNPNERLTVHHNGMMFTAVTDEDGLMSVKVPALAENASFMVNFATGRTLVAQTEVTSLDFYDRAVVQWKGDISLQIHALEFGADYGQEGHVWAENPGTLERMISGQGGVITRLGDAGSPEALHAEVYTFPTLTSKQEGDVFLTVEAEVSEQNCDREIEAQSIQYTSGQKPKVQDLVLSMPACDAFGGYLLLKNLLEDLTIAHN